MNISFDEIKLTPYIKDITDSIPIKPEFNEIEIKDFYIPMSDGIKLFCKGAFPVGMEKLPVILTRTPYGMESLRFFHEMAFYGYICIAQSCRGCFGSEGKWEPGSNERSDGIDTLNYIKTQPWCDGNIGLTGTSYLTMCQYLLSDILPTEVKTLNFEVFSPYRYDLLYTNGMFHLEAYAGWTAYNSGIKKPKFPPSEAYDKMLNHIPQITADVDVLGKPIDWYRSWISESSRENPIWNEGPYGVLKGISQKISVPLLFHAGWYDPHLSGMINSWNSLNPQTREKSYMIITPTNHKQGLCADFETSRAFDIVGPRFVISKLNWFGHHLKGQNYFQDVNEGCIDAYIYGMDKYITFKNKFGTETDNLKNKLYIDISKMELSETEPQKQKPISYTYNPLTPVKTCGSEFILTDYIYHKHKKTAEGRRLQPASGFREDVVTLISRPFEKDTLIENKIIVKLTVSTSAPDTAFFVKVSTEEKLGQFYYLRGSITSLSAEGQSGKLNTPVEVSFTLSHICVLIKKGKRIRLDITSSDFPAFNAHPNTISPWASEANPICAKQFIYGGTICF